MNKNGNIFTKRIMLVPRKGVACLIFNSGLFIAIMGVCCLLILAAVSLPGVISSGVEVLERDKPFATVFLIAIGAGTNLTIIGSLVEMIQRNLRKSAELKNLRS